jgi:protein-tyrosine-phosphatase
MAEPVYNVLFLCTGNSARSIMAEAILARVGKGRFRAFSAGSRPAGKVADHALSLLQTLGYDTAAFRSKSWDEFGKPGAPEMDFVFTVCDEAAGETCPIWPGHPSSGHWSIPDPAKTTGSHAEISAAYDEAYRMLSNRIGAFVNLPLDKLDHASLHHHLQQIAAGP